MIYHWFIFRIGNEHFGNEYMNSHTFSLDVFIQGYLLITVTERNRFAYYHFALVKTFDTPEIADLIKPFVAGETSRHCSSGRSWMSRE